MEKETKKETKKMSPISEALNTLVSPHQERMNRNTIICTEYATAKRERPDVSDNLICTLIGSRYGLCSQSIRYIVRKYSSTFNN